jgi:hypothetical protein
MYLVERECAVVVHEFLVDLSSDHQSVFQDSGGWAGRTLIASSAVIYFMPDMVELFRLTRLYPL